MKKVLNVAVIGCGRISVMHLESVKMLGHNLVAVCDKVESVANATAEKYGCRAYVDYIEMLDTERLDAVHICLPHYIHCEVSRAAIERGIAVLSEKPMDIGYEVAEKTVELAEERGVPYGIIFQCRYNNSAQLVKKAYQSGKLGKILSARSVLTWNRPDSYYLGSDWKGTWEKEGGGVVIDQAIHSIDLVNWIIDSPVVSVRAALSKHADKVCEVEDTASGIVTYENGTVFGFYCMNNYAVDEPIEIRLECEKARVVFDYNDAYIYYKDGRVDEAHPNVDRIELGGLEYWGFQHTRQIRQFYAAVMGEEPLEITGREALKTHALVCDIYKIGKRTLI